MSDIQEKIKTNILLSLLRDCVNQRDAFVQKKNSLEIEFHQLSGAIVGCNEMISKLQNSMKENMEALDQDNHGEKNNVGTDNEKTEQAS